MNGTQERITICLIACLLAAPLLFGGAEECIPTNVPTAEVPFTIDVAQLAPDPSTGVRYLMRWTIVEVGTEVFFNGDVCDPDGDAVKAVVAGEPQKYSVTYDPNDGAWAFTFTPTSIGTHYCRIEATDDVGEFSRTGISNIVVSAVPANRPPALRCGGQ